jgi:phospholipase/lecithinase/hemolysin
VTGQTTDQEVVMLGDSYMDYANVGPTIMQDAGNRMFRHYYLAGAAMNYGALNLNIPYQFDTSALMDTSVTNPTDIKVVIMDGGGNDILIDNSQCLTTPVAGDTTCHTAIQGTLTRAQQLLQDESSKGAQHIVYYFYPDLDPNVSGHQYAGAWVDYAYPLAAAMCCGSANVPASGDLSCHGNVTSTTDCTWVDTRPLFVGHNNSADPSTYWFMSDNIHPTQPGATAIAAKVWAAMQQYCVAQ